MASVAGKGAGFSIWEGQDGNCVDGGILSSQGESYVRLECKAKRWSESPQQICLGQPDSDSEVSRVSQFPFFLFFVKMYDSMICSIFRVMQPSPLSHLA